MTFHRLLTPLLGAAFLVIAVFLGAGGANAHPGHPHTGGVAAHTGTGAAPILAVSAVSPSNGEADVAIASPEMAADAAERPAPLAVVSATALQFEIAIESGRAAPDAPCRGLCCDNTPCGGCVKVAFGNISLPSPLLGASVLASVEARKLSGHLVDGPNEPPKTFI